MSRFEAAPGAAAGSRASRPERIAAHLRDEVLRGVYAAGERLPGERELAERLGASRSSVREALKELAHLGLVDIRQGDGVRVRPLSEASLEIVRPLLFLDGQPDLDLVGQLLDVHEALLVSAVRLAVRNASDDELDRARTLLASAADPALGDSEYLAVVVELMQLISVASRNLVLRLVRNAFRSAFSPQASPQAQGQRPAVRLRPARSVVSGLAAAIQAALEARDPAAAEEGVRALLQANRELFLKRLEARISASGSSSPPPEAAPASPIHEGAPR